MFLRFLSKSRPPPLKPSFSTHVSATSFNRTTTVLLTNCRKRPRPTSFSSNANNQNPPILCKSKEIDAGIDAALYQIRLKEYNKRIASTFLKDSNRGGTNTFEKQMKRVERILNQMSKEGIKPDAVAYTTMIHGRLQNYEQSNWQQEEEVWNEVDTLFSEMLSNQIQPDIYCYTTILSGNAKTAEYAAIRERENELGIGPQGNTILDIAGNAEVNANSLKLCHNRAEDIWSHMTTSSSSATSFSNIVFPDGHTYSAMIRTSIAAHESERALYYFQHMLENIENPNINISSIEICRHLLSTNMGILDIDLLITNHFENVFKKIEASFKNKPIDADRMFNSLCRGMGTYEDDHSIHFASICMNAFQDSQHALHHVVLNHTTCNNILQSFCKSNNTTSALDLHDFMKQSNITIEPISYNSLLNALSTCISDLNEIKTDAPTRKQLKKALKRLKLKTKTKKLKSKTKKSKLETQVELEYEMNIMMEKIKSIFTDMKAQHWKRNSLSWMNGNQNRDSNNDSNNDSKHDRDWIDCPGGLSQAYSAVFQSCKTLKDAVSATHYFEEMLRDDAEIAPLAQHVQMGWQTSGIDTRAVQVILPLLQATVTTETFQTLMHTFDPTLVRILTTAASTGTISQNRNYNDLIKQAFRCGDYER